ncbi:hypothetical protein PG984_011562 [Apiospora sp. TS-2023a]
MDTHQHKCPYLPLEVWTRIIGFVTDCHYLPRVWLNCRRVSHAFKAATETAFISRHFPHTHIEFDVRRKEVLRDVDGNKVGLDDIVVKFSHLSEDRERAVFVGERAYEEDKTRLSSGRTMYDVLIGNWRRRLTKYMEDPTIPINWPCHMLYVRREVNDTVLPGLQIDFDKVEVSVLWKPMLSMLYGETKYLKWAQKVESQSIAENELAKRFHAGEISLDEFIRSAATASERTDKVQHEVRRQRLLRWHEKNGSLENSDVAIILSNSLKRTYLEWAQDGVLDDEFDDEHKYGRYEKGQGNFYDGLGFKFLGNTETGPSTDEKEEVREEVDEEEDGEDDDGGPYFRRRRSV